jgi:pyruvate dehydrogenase E2 component (dihydrolipoamide acetyltransferase)
MAREFKLPELGEGITSGVVATVLVAVGDTIALDQPVLELETDKAVTEIPSPIAGKITKLSVSEGQTIEVGSLILVTDESVTAKTPSKPKPASQPKSEPTPQPVVRTPVVSNPPTGGTLPGGAVLASPSVRRLAREHGVNLADVLTADPTGRITAQEVLNVSQGTPEIAPKTTPVATPMPAAILEGIDVASDAWGPVAQQPMNAIRKKTVEHMTHCWTTIPHVTHFDKADITSLEVIRKKYAPKVAAAGGKLTGTSFILKIVAEALKRFPKFNASIDLEGQKLLLKQYYNLGVAVETEQGLLVPVLRDVDQKSITQLSLELPQLAGKARDRKLGLDEMQGGTFTVTNLGGIGGENFTPIINAPQAAILGVSRAKIEPVHQNGQFAPRTMLPLSLSYDHRVIDGAEAARFMRWVCEALEQPWIIFLDGE